MSAETSLYSALSAAAPVTAIVGVGSAARIYPDVIPQDKAVPALAYARVETEPTYTIHSASPAITRTTLDIYALDDDRAGAEALADAAAAALAGSAFVLRNRRFEYDPENDLYATVLTVEFNS